MTDTLFGDIGERCYIRASQPFWTNDTLDSAAFNSIINSMRLVLLNVTLEYMKFRDTQILMLLNMTLGGLEPIKAMCNCFCKSKSLV